MSFQKQTKHVYDSNIEEKLWTSLLCWLVHMAERCKPMQTLLCRVGACTRGRKGAQNRKVSTTCNFQRQVWSESDVQKATLTYFDSMFCATSMFAAAGSADAKSFTGTQKSKGSAAPWVISQLHPHALRIYPSTSFMECNLIKHILWY